MTKRNLEDACFCNNRGTKKNRANKVGVFHDIVVDIEDRYEESVMNGYTIVENKNKIDGCTILHLLIS